MSGLVISVDPELDAAPFQQIADQVRELIERGRLRPGDPIPTVRRLANDLRVAPNTVARAYADLQDQGWLTTDGRRGTRVAQSTPADDVKGRALVLRGDVAEFITGLRRRGYAKREIAAALQHGAARC